MIPSAIPFSFFNAINPELHKQLYLAGWPGVLYLFSHEYNDLVSGTRRTGRARKNLIRSDNSVRVLLYF